MKALLTTTLILALAPVAQVPTLEVRLSTANVSVGERFQVTVEARGPIGTTYEFPKEIREGAADLVQSRASSSMAGVAVYEAQLFATGAAGQIPQLEVSYRFPDGTTGAAKSVPVPVNVISSLDPEEKNPAPAPFAPPLPVLVSRAFWLVSSAAGLLLLTGLVLLIRRIRLPKKPVDLVATPAISPEEQALRDLEELASVHATADPKAFYIRLVQVAKQYLERRLDAPVLEMTSSETVAFVRGHEWTAAHSVAVRELVASADLVKFSKATDASRADRQIQVVRDLVGQVDRLRRAEEQGQAGDLRLGRSA